MSTKSLPVIQRNETLPTGVQYQALIEKAIGYVARYSNEVWTNYNASDPGITLLQSLVYALVELGVKADLPIRDLLAQPDGSIRYQNQFVPAQDALTTNPVTLEDFRSLLLNQVPDVKQVAFTVLPAPNGADGKPLGQFNTIAVELEAMPEVVSTTKRSTKTSDMVVGRGPSHTELSTFQILLRHANVGQAFLFPTTHKAFPVYLQGTLALDSKVLVEEYIANLLYALNNYFSPYPEFENLPQQHARGLDNSTIFAGPAVSKGYLTTNPDQEHLSTNSITAFELESVILNVAGTEYAADLELSSDGTTWDSSLTVPSGQSPQVTWDCLKESLDLQQNSKTVPTPNPAKISYYYQRLLPANQAKGKLVPEEEKGQYYDLEAYYSMQYQIPSKYRLTQLRKDTVSREDEGKIKQLKGFLSLMEQTMADFLSQTSNLDELFSFRSGRNPLQVTSKTYFPQGIYNVPGMQYLLKGARESLSAIPKGQTVQSVWREYQQDPFNDYWRALTAAQEQPNEQLDRKRRVMEHLLARFGQTYSNESLQLTNPNFGDGTSAEVWHISQLLCHFAVNSQNRLRTYFYTQTTAQGKVEDDEALIKAYQAQEAKLKAGQPVSQPLSAQDVTKAKMLLAMSGCQEPLAKYTFASGIERNLEAELNLRAYYQGIIEIIQTPYNQGPDDLCIKVVGPQVEVYHQGSLILQVTPDDPSTWAGYDCTHYTASPEEGSNLNSLLAPYTMQLAQLRDKFQGFLWIDPYALLPWLTYQDSTGQTITFSEWASQTTVDGIKVANPVDPTSSKDFPTTPLESFAVFPDYVAEINAPQYQVFLHELLLDAMPAGQCGWPISESLASLTNLIMAMEDWQAGLLLLYRSSDPAVLNYLESNGNSLQTVENPSSQAEIIENEEKQTLDQAREAAYTLWNYLQTANAA